MSITFDLEIRANMILEELSKIRLILALDWLERHNRAIPDFEDVIKSIEGFANDGFFSAIDGQYKNIQEK